MKAAILAVLLLAMLGCTANWKDLNTRQGRAEAAARSEASRNPFIKPLDGTLPKNSSQVVYSVTPGSPAALGGLQPGDTLIEVDGRPLQTLLPLRDYLAGLPIGATTSLLIGSASGRRDTNVALQDQPPRLGIATPTVIVGDTLVEVYDGTATVQGYVSRWSEFTVVRVDVFNRSDASLTFGPDSVTVLGGDSEVVTALSPEQAITLKFGGTATDVAGDVPSSMASAIVGGAAAGIARGTRQVATKNILDNSLRKATVPPGARHGGALFIGRKNIVEPITVRVLLAGHVYIMRFGTATK